MRGGGPAAVLSWLLWAAIQLAPGVRPVGASEGELSPGSAQILIHQIEALLDAGQYVRAFDLADSRQHYYNSREYHIESMAEFFGDDSEDRVLLQRLYLLHLTAQLRVGLLAEAAATLLQHLQHQPDDSYLLALRGELLSRSPQTAPIARVQLERLAATGALRTSQGYAALAQLRAAAGDLAGADQALARCRGLATAATLCTDPVPPRLWAWLYRWMQLQRYGRGAADYLGCYALDFQGVLPGGKPLLDRVAWLKRNLGRFNTGDTYILELKKDFQLSLAATQPARGRLWEASFVEVWHKARHDLIVGSVSIPKRLVLLESADEIVIVREEVLPAGG